MAKSKVINTVLNLRDNMSGGLLKAAQNAKKSGAKIDDSMIKSTRQVVAFKNKSVKAMQDFAKKSAVAAGAAATGLATAFIALDGATEEYRVAQGKLNTAFDAAGFSAEVARKSYRNFYAILGDTDTATEASQLLAQLAENEQDVSTWTRIAAGAHGTFGDSLPIEGLIESSNETAKVGEVTGVLADALNWGALAGEKFGVTLKANTDANEEWNKAVSEATSAEDYFNLALQDCRNESERYKLIMDSLSKAYDGAATAFYENNKQVINARRNQATLSEVTAKLGDTSALVKNRLWEMFGAATDGTIRPGSALEWLTQKATAFSDWVESVDVSALTTQFDQGFATAVEKAGKAFDWVQSNGDTIISVLKTIAAAWGIAKVVQFVGSVISAGTTIFNFVKTAGVLISANPIVIGIGLAIAAGALLIANWDKIKEGASALWEKAQETFGGIKDSIVGAFDSAKEKVSGFFSWLDDKIESIPLLGSLYSGGKTALSWLGDQLTGNALGTSYWRGGLTRVNERGGEIINLPSGTQIIPHDVSARMAGGPQVTVNVTVAGNVIGNRQYADELGETIVEKILRALDNM